MKLYLVSDMEGITGVHDTKQTRPDGADYEQARDYLMSDLNAAIQGAVDGGADEVVIYDLHESGKNIRLQQLPVQASLISGKPPVTYGRYGIDGSFDGLFLIGNHAKTYTENAVFPHAYSLQDARLEVNGLEVGEIGMEALIAGSYGVPLALVTGDKAASEEAGQLCSQTETAVVKYNSGFGSALCLPPARTQTIIYEAAKRAVQRLDEIPPVRIEPPYQIRITFNGEAYRPLAQVEGMEVSGNTYCLTGDNLHRLWESINLCYSRQWL